MPLTESSLGGTQYPHSHIVPETVVPHPDLCLARLPFGLVLSSLSTLPHIPHCPQLPRTVRKCAVVMTLSPSPFSLQLLTEST